MWSLRGVLAVVVALAGGCGRIGFDPTAISPRDGDAVLGDGGAALGDGNQATSCTAPSPFVYLIAPREEGSTGGQIPVTWCSAGISGVLAVSLISADGVTVHSSTTAPITANIATLSFGVACTGCFVRLEVGAVRHDGPAGEHQGD